MLNLRSFTSGLTNNTLIGPAETKTDPLAAQELHLHVNVLNRRLEQAETETRQKDRVISYVHDIIHKDLIHLKEENMKLKCAVDVLQDTSLRVPHTTHHKKDISLVTDAVEFRAEGAMQRGEEEMQHAVCIYTTIISYLELLMKGSSVPVESKEKLERTFPTQCVEQAPGGFPSNQNSIDQFVASYVSNSLATIVHTIERAHKKTVRWQQRQHNEEVIKLNTKIKLMCRLLREVEEDFLREHRKNSVPASDKAAKTEFEEEEDMSLDYRIYLSKLLRNRYIENLIIERHKQREDELVLNGKLDIENEFIINESLRYSEGEKALARITFGRDLLYVFERFKLLEEENERIKEALAKGHILEKHSNGCCSEDSDDDSESDIIQNSKKHGSTVSERPASGVSTSEVDELTKTISKMELEILQLKQIIKSEQNDFPVKISMDELPDFVIRNRLDEHWDLTQNMIPALSERIKQLEAELEKNEGLKTEVPASEAQNNIIDTVPVQPNYNSVNSLSRQKVELMYRRKLAAIEEQNRLLLVEKVKRNAENDRLRQKIKKLLLLPDVKPKEPAQEEGISTVSEQEVKLVETTQALARVTNLYIKSEKEIESLSNQVFKLRELISECDEAMEFSRDIRENMIKNRFTNDVSTSTEDFFTQNEQKKKMTSEFNAGVPNNNGCKIDNSLTGYHEKGEVRNTMSISPVDMEVPVSNNRITKEIINSAQPTERQQILSNKNIIEEGLVFKDVKTPEIASSSDNQEKDAKDRQINLTCRQTHFETKSSNLPEMSNMNHLSSEYKGESSTLDYSNTVEIPGVDHQSTLKQVTKPLEKNIIKSQLNNSGPALVTSLISQKNAKKEYFNNSVKNVDLAKLSGVPSAVSRIKYSEETNYSFLRTKEKELKTMLHSIPGKKNFDSLLKTGTNDLLTASPSVFIEENDNKRLVTEKFEGDKSGGAYVYPDSIRRVSSTVDSGYTKGPTCAHIAVPCGVDAEGGLTYNNVYSIDYIISLLLSGKYNRKVPLRGAHPLSINNLSIAEGDFPTENEIFCTLPDISSNVRSIFHAYLRDPPKELQSYWAVHWLKEKGGYFQNLIDDIVTFRMKLLGYKIDDSVINRNLQLILSNDVLCNRTSYTVCTFESPNSCISDRTIADDVTKKRLINWNTINTGLPKITRRPLSASRVNFNVYGK